MRLAPILAALLAMGCDTVPSAAVGASGFDLQGEYAGSFGSPAGALGAQVIDLGGGAFTAVFLTGGLPGAGWDGTGRIEMPGAQRGDSAVFEASGGGAGGAGSYTASIPPDGSRIAGTTPQGEPFLLAKVIRKSPTLGAPPPPGALVLFDGSDLSAFAAGSATLDSGLLLPQGSAATGAVTVRRFGDFTLHLEFLVPYMPDRTGQARGNSGIYLQGRYELQILDSFGLDPFRAPGAETRECGAFYEAVGPLLNMSLPPLSWQTYDVEFRKAAFEGPGGAQSAPARATVRLNGVVIHENRELPNPTLLGDPVTAADGPLRFQAHGDPVKFRNIWIVEGSGSAVRPRRAGEKRGSLRQGAMTGSRSAATVDGRKVPDADAADLAGASMVAGTPPNPRNPGASSGAYFTVGARGARILVR